MAYRRLRRAAIVLAAALCGFVAAAARAAPADGPADGTWSQVGPPIVSSGRTVYVDPVDGRLTLFDARSERRYWKFDPADGGPWTPAEIVGPIPNLIAFYGPVVDRAQRRLVALGFNGRFFPGGFEPDTFQVWQFPLEGVRSWSRLSTQGMPPRGRYAPAVTLDEATGTLYLVGGTDETVDSTGYRLIPYGDTWALDLSGVTPTWSAFPVAGPGLPGAYDGGAVFDPSQRTLVVYGAQDSLGTDRDSLQISGYTQDTWSLSLTPGEGWIPLAIAGSAPVGRSGHAAAYDPVGDRMILLWGRDQSGARFDCHALDFGSPARWVDFLPVGEGPAPVTGAFMHYDAPRDRLLILGESGVTGGAVQAIEFDRPGAQPPPFPADGPSLRLLGVGPNPSRGDVRIAFDVPRPIDVRLRLFDVRGRVVRDFGERRYLPGSHVMQWDGRGDDGARVRDGVYFARIEVAGEVVTGKLVVMD